MCVYSAYVSEVNKQWPGIMTSPSFQPFNPGIAAPMMTPTTDPRILQEILDIGKRLDRIDKALGLKDCIQEAAAKKAFEDRLTQLIENATALKNSVECNDKSIKQHITGSGQLTGDSTYTLSGGPVYVQVGSQTGQSLGDGPENQAKINY